MARTGRPTKLKAVHIPLHIFEGLQRESDACGVDTSTLIILSIYEHLERGGRLDQVELVTDAEQ